ncbi:MAG TPA: exodeoxyribonuclease VII small subunit [Candidatus Scybalocola faecigallinarum]|uniref:Exodeoxyribonuclease 7 small subunit n=1 Tax=Candidatus Scybalocola faecigallinarum TaxID=2840941 RepID=A0A9D1F4Z9_9FIRM|nr:exodeoxyribonuclease VII small subunit [Candidatus Scybalocola faecigallinarum]
MAKGKTLEAAFEELDETIAALEDPDVTLDESLKLYQQGIKLLKFCNDSIDKVEKKIIELKTEDEENDI